MNLKALGLGSILALSLSFAAYAGTVADTDGDGIPDEFDNCSEDANGAPNEFGSCASQFDFDGDGYGNACDGDFDNDGIYQVTDINQIVSNFNTANDPIDIDCDGTIQVSDLNFIVARFNTNVGPSGLGCAGINPGSPTDCTD